MHFSVVRVNMIVDSLTNPLSYEVAGKHVEPYEYLNDHFGQVADVKTTCPATISKSLSYRGRAS